MYLTYYPASGRAICKACGKKIEKDCLQMRVKQYTTLNFHAIHADCEEMKKAFIDGCNKLYDSLNKDNYLTKVSDEKMAKSEC